VKESVKLEKKLLEEAFVLLTTCLEWLQLQKIRGVLGVAHIQL
jgi:hypothetical protein